MQGASYEFIDTDCPALDCFYKLEDIDVDLVSTFRGPVAVEPALSICGTSVSARGVNHSVWFVLPVAIILWWMRRKRKKAL